MKWSVLTMATCSRDARPMVSVQCVDDVTVIRAMTGELTAVWRTCQTDMWTVAGLAGVRRYTQYSQQRAINNNDTNWNVKKSNCSNKVDCPKIDEAPARCRERIAKSTDGPLWAMFLARGGYTVHPVPTPFTKSIDSSKSDREGRSNHRLRLFRGGVAMLYIGNS